MAKFLILFLLFTMGSVHALGQEAYSPSDVTAFGTLISGSLVRGDPAYGETAEGAPSGGAFVRYFPTKHFFMQVDYDAMKFKDSSIGFHNIGLMVNARLFWGAFSPFVGVGGSTLQATNMPAEFEADKSIKKSAFGIKAQGGLEFRPSDIYSISTGLKVQHVTMSKPVEANMVVYLPYLGVTIYRDFADW